MIPHIFFLSSGQTVIKLRTSIVHSLPASPLCLVFSPFPVSSLFLFPSYIFNIELKLGRVLGRGGFCVVNEVTKITLAAKGSNNGEATTTSTTTTTMNNNNNNNNKLEDEHQIHNVVQDRAFMAQHCIRRGKDCRYAIKRVQEASRKDPQLFINAVVDLAIESRFLAVVRHPNIIKMRAMDNHGPFQPTFFVVLDRLYDIMPIRLKKWKKQQGGSLKKIFKSKKQKEAFYVERLSVAYDIACALSYLHGLKYVCV